MLNGVSLRRACRSALNVEGQSFVDTALPVLVNKHYTDDFDSEGQGQNGV